MTNWREDVSMLLGSALLSRAVDQLKERTARAPDDAEAWRALMKICAAQDDYVGARTALAGFLHTRARSGTESSESLEPKWIVNDEIRLKIAQLWVSHEGRNVEARAYLYRALESFSWYVPPPTETESVAESGERHEHLRAAFEASSPTTPEELSLWRDWVQESDVMAFRGEFCVSQAGAYDPSNFGPARLPQAYALAYEQALAYDRLGLLDKCWDDGAFGGLLLRIDGRILSSDMINSCLELNFLAHRCRLDPLKPMRLLDIGAGWGRLVARFLETFPNGTAYVIDALPFMSLCAQRHLEHKGLLPRAIVGGRKRRADVEPSSIEIATNVHSWSEAPLASIEIWLDELDRLRVRRLFFVPHGLPAYSMESGGSRKLVLPAILARGWHIIADEPKYGGSLQRQQFGLYSTAHYYLFERSG